MFVDIELTDEEFDRIQKGGFITMSFPNSIQITVTKDTLGKAKNENRNRD